MTPLLRLLFLYLSCSIIRSGGGLLYLMVVFAIYQIELCFFPKPEPTSRRASPRSVFVASNILAEIHTLSGSRVRRSSASSP